MSNGQAQMCGWTVERAMMVEEERTEESLEKVGEGGDGKRGERMAARRDAGLTVRERGDSDRGT